jgi:uncharacterized protein (DUF433 family)
MIPSLHAKVKTVTKTDEAFDASVHSRYNQVAEVKLEAMDTQDRIETPTDHPHIVRVAGVCGGDPIVRGTRVRVADVVGYYRVYNGDLNEVLKDLPSLSKGQVLDALAYYADHTNEIDALMAEDEAVNGEA